jgi:hypothetical protein
LFGFDSFNAERYTSNIWRLFKDYGCTWGANFEKSDHFYTVGLKKSFTNPESVHKGVLNLSRLYQEVVNGEVAYQTQTDVTNGRDRLLLSLFLGKLQCPLPAVPPLISGLPPFKSQVHIFILLLLFIYFIY